jgi:uncharacterized protein YaeQ
LALGATIHHFEVALSDVDRGVYETLDLRVAQHPSETTRFLLTRTLAYCLAYEEGIAFSKGGISSTDEPPISIRDRTGLLLAWIDVGTPAADRLHKAAKAARRVLVFTSADLATLRREAASRTIHRAAEIEVHRLDPAFLDALAARLGRSAKIELTHTAGQLYVTTAGATLEGSVERAPLVDP